MAASPWRSVSRVLVAAAALAAAAAQQGAPQVNVTLYEESLCPDCIRFITTIFYPAWTTKGLGYGSVVGDGKGIFSTLFVPYGNARSSGGKTTCQHGPNECKYNIVENCVLKHAPEPARWIPFVYCLESTPGGPNDAAAAACAKASKIDYAGVIEPCATGPEGLALEADSAAATAALQPPHQYVPWVTLSSAPGAGTFCTEAGCDDFVAAVCAAYTGPKPAACPAAGAAAPKLRGVSGVHHKD